MPGHHDVKCERHHDDKIMEVSCTELLQNCEHFFEMPNNVTMSVPMVTVVGNIIMVDSHQHGRERDNARETQSESERVEETVATKRNGIQGTSM